MTSSPFHLHTPFSPRGDQPQAIEKLLVGLRAGEPLQTLLGITGSGKTFTIANVIEQWGRPTLVMAPNKTLAAQLYEELKGFFPDNAVRYFVSYYDYYQPEAYVPTTDTFIEKDAIINDEIDRMRHAATRELLSRKDVIIVASVSCIYGIGASESYLGLAIEIEQGQELRRDQLLRQLVDIQYQRNDLDFHRGTFRVRGDVVEIFPVDEEDRAIRLEFFGDEVEAIDEIDPLRGKRLRSLAAYSIFPGSHYVTPKDQLRQAIKSISEELEPRLAELEAEGRLLERQRLEQRTRYDLEMLEQMGFVQGIENYSRHLSGRAPGEPPPTLIDYFPEDFLLIMDESHQSIPQVGAMYKGDRARKQNLVDYGFRLPSALDNRPLRFEEFKQHMRHTLFLSATPGKYEEEHCKLPPVQQLIRPTGLMDPEIFLRPVRGQVDDLYGEIQTRVRKQQRVLVTTLTKRMAEDLTEYYSEQGVRVRYLHSDIDTLERIELLRALRAGEYDVLVGINLLREGLDLPEVSLVAILDADKEGFLRSERSLIQTIGRAARNVEGQVLMYGDRVTPSMQLAMDETARRRALQNAYNKEHGISPETVVRALAEASGPEQGDYMGVSKKPSRSKAQSPGDLAEQIEALRDEMLAAAEQLEFEKAAKMRDELESLRRQLDPAAVASSPPKKKKKRANKRGRR